MDERFAAWFARALADRGLEGVGDAARAIGVSQSMVSNWLNGKTLPARKSVRKLAAALGQPAAEITTRIEVTSAELHHPPPVSGIVPAEDAPATLAALARPALLYLGPHGWIDGVDGLTEAEAASVLASIKAMRARRASGEAPDAASDPPGAGGPH